MVPKFLKSVSAVFLFALLVIGVVGYTVAPSSKTVSAQSPDVESPDDILHDDIPITLDLPSAAIVDQPVTLNAYIGHSPEGYSFTWSFGDGTAIEEDDQNHITHIYETTGLRTVTVIVTNGNDTGTASANLRVVPPPPTSTPTPEPPRDASIETSLERIGNNLYRVGPNINFTLIARVRDGAPLHYKWTLPNPDPFDLPGDTSVLVHKFTEYDVGNIHAISVEVSNDGGLESATILIQVLPQPITGLTFATSKVVDADELAPIGVLIEAGTDVEYDIDFGDGTQTGYLDGTLDKSYFSSHKYAWRAGEPNEYLVTVKARNAATSNPVEIKQCIVVRPPPIKNLRIVGTDYVPSPSDPLDITALHESGIVTEYKWGIIDPVTQKEDLFSDTQSFRGNFSSSGIYLIRVMVIGPLYKAKGCTDTPSEQQTSIAETIVVVGDQEIPQNRAVPGPFPPDPAAVIIINGERLTSASNRIAIEMGREATFEYFGPKEPEGTQDESSYGWIFGDDQPAGVAMAMGRVVTYTYEVEGAYPLQAISGLDIEGARAFYAVVNVTGQRTHIPALILPALPLSRLSLNPSPTDSVVNQPAPTHTSLPPTSTPVPPTSTPSSTPMPPTNTPPATNPPIATATPTNTFTSTPANTSIPTNAPTSTPLPATNTPTNTPVPPTSTPLPPTNTPLTPTNVPTATSLPVATATPTEIFTSVPVNTLNPTNTPISAITAIPTSTPRPPDPPTSTSTPSPTSTSTSTSTPTITPIPTSTRAP